MRNYVVMSANMKCKREKIVNGNFWLDEQLYLSNWYKMVQEDLKQMNLEII